MLSFTSIMLARGKIYSIFVRRPVKSDNEPRQQHNSHNDDMLQREIKTLCSCIATSRLLLVGSAHTKKKLGRLDDKRESSGIMLAVL
jgi:hypothetical protein